MPQEVSVAPSQNPATAPHKIGVKLLARAVVTADDPGHMSVTWKQREARIYRGFRFRILDLPSEVRAPSQWRSYLFDHKVPGYVVDDIMLQDSIARFGGNVLCKQWQANGSQIDRLDARSATGRQGWYSFEPQKHTDCHNCVTWAITAVNAVLGGVLPPVPNGRIKLAIEMLRAQGAEPSA